MNTKEKTSRISKFFMSPFFYLLFYFLTLSFYFNVYFVVRMVGNGSYEVEFLKQDLLITLSTALVSTIGMYILIYLSLKKK